MSTTKECSTTVDDIKRVTMIKYLRMQSIQSFRDLNICEFDLNITQRMDELEEIDEEVTPLVYCAYYGLKEIMKLFLTHPLIDVDLQTPNNKQTPLITACMRGHYEITRLLLLKQAECNKPNALGHGALAGVIFRLVEHPVSFQNTTMCFRIAQMLIKSGANVNWIIDKQHGYSLLHYFCKVKSSSSSKEICKEILRFLLRNGGDIMQLTLDDRNCWDIANQEIRSILREYIKK